MLKFPASFIIQPKEDGGGGGSTPTGTITLSENGIHNVAEYANAKVEIFSVKDSVKKDTKIKSNVNGVISESIIIEQV